MTAKEHYDSHLGELYSWMTGDFETGQRQQQSFFEEHGIRPLTNGAAIDLGAGHGMHAVSLARLGYSVKAIDFNQHLLNELVTNSRGLSVIPVNDNITALRDHAEPRPELITCMGDTLTHLDTFEELEVLLLDCAEVLSPHGRLVLSFRDYTHEPPGDAKFLQVKSDEDKILTCCLFYEPLSVKVTDLLHYKTAHGWKLKDSSYFKLRVSPQYVESLLEENDMDVLEHKSINGMVHLIAKKKE